MSIDLFYKDIVMEINLFGNKFNIGRSKSSQNNFISSIENNYWGMSFVGNSITDCGKVRIDKKTMYRVYKNNKMAFAYAKKIEQMVAAKGIEVVDYEGRLVEWREDVVKNLQKFIGKKHEFASFRQKFFAQHFCSGNVLWVPSMINGGGFLVKWGKFKILDTRGITKKTDKYGEKMEYIYTTGGSNAKYNDMQIIDFVTNLDVDNSKKGVSIYESVVMDAIMQHESSRTQMYFFKNDQRPNMFIMLNPEMFQWSKGAQKKAEFDDIRKKKYEWPSNSWKSKSSYLIKDIKTLDVSNVDLDLINLRKSNDEAISVVYMLDNRLIWLQKWTGSYGEVESTTIMQGNEQINAYGSLLGDFLTAMYTQFVDPKFEYCFQTRNLQFRNINADKEIALKELVQGVITEKEYRAEFWY